MCTLKTRLFRQMDSRLPIMARFETASACWQPTCFSSRGMNDVVVPGQPRPNSWSGLIRVLLSVFCLSACAVATAQQSASLSWAPSSDSITVGYYIYYGGASHTYTNKIDVGLNTNFVVSGLEPGNTYYFAVTSYTADGVESTPSGELSLSPMQFLDGSVALGNNVEFLKFANGNVFGYYSPVGFPWIYHNDLGYEYLFDAADGAGGVYFYDYASGDFWYTGSTLFPYVYDFTLNAWLYYYHSSVPDHYTSNPRSFYNFSTDTKITL